MASLTYRSENILASSERHTRTHTVRDPPGRALKVLNSSFPLGCRFFLRRVLSIPRARTTVKGSGQLGSGLGAAGGPSAAWVRLARPGLLQNETSAQVEETLDDAPSFMFPEMRDSLGFTCMEVRVSVHPFGDLAWGVGMSKLLHQRFVTPHRVQWGVPRAWGGADHVAGCLHWPWQEAQVLPGLLPPRPGDWGDCAHSFLLHKEKQGETSFIL